MLKCTGPGLPLTAISNALSMKSGMRLPSVTSTDHFVTASAMRTWSTSLKPPCPRRLRVLEPVIKTTGERAPYASSIAGTTLPIPSGPTRHTAGFLVKRAIPSARWPAICSWGALTTRIPYSFNPSRIGLMKPPDNVNTKSIFFSASVLATSRPPLSFRLADTPSFRINSTPGSGLSSYAAPLNSCYMCLSRGNLSAS